VDAEGRFLGGQIIAARQIPPGGPVLDPARRAVEVIRQLSRADFGAAAPVIEPDGAIRPR
jgi:hypothetical protein